MYTDTYIFIMHVCLSPSLYICVFVQYCVSVRSRFTSYPERCLWCENRFVDTNSARRIDPYKPEGSGV